MTFSPVGVAFNGVDTRLTRGGQLTGVNSTSATVSYWIRKNNTDYGFVYTNTDNSVASDGQNNPTVFLFDTANANGLQWSSVATINDNAWHHIIASADFSTGRWALYIDGQFDSAPTIIGTPATIYLSSPNWAVGDSVIAGNKWHGDIAELFISVGYLDLSVQANLAKFYNGGAIDLGADGSLPFGSQPLVYLSARSGDAETVFAANRGTGGGFTIGGTLALSGSGPNAGTPLGPRGGGGRRRYVVLKDGTRLFPKSDVEFRSIIAAIVSEARAAEFPKDQAPIKRKPGRKPKIAPKVPVTTERWNNVFAALAAMTTKAITEADIIRAAMLALEDEEEVLALLLH